ncbi:type III PLP-dependent enzyme [Dickeya zeae]|uniref:Type III PLP-dependent enzyme n=1 Tax=Dickeya zeae TaxID=204042 RepID=A0AAE6Z2L5_9GAMM|nr:type III PLP-dependent enzyme [Dickeya zeae]QIZ52939.1 type III PLP-dependent enzyme [Dickeya zeae]
MADPAHPATQPDALFANDGLFANGNVEEIPVATIARHVGTPFYVYSARQLRRQLQHLYQRLPAGTAVYYSLKANPNLSVVKTLVEQGAGCEVCSPAELDTALAAGVLPQHMLYVGPGKSLAALAHAMNCGIRAIVAESVTELDNINQLAAQAGTVQTVALRINPDFSSEHARLVMSGKPTQFGMTLDTLQTVLASLSRWPSIVVRGFHVYLGTRILNAQAIADNTRNILQLALNLREKYQLTLDFVDIGGGFGVPYFPKETQLDLPALGDAIAPIVANFRRQAADTQIIIELGRYLVAEAGLFVTRVNTLKTAGGKTFAICDGGANCHSAAAGLNSMLRKNFPLLRLGDNQSRPLQPYQVSGPLCTPTDLLGDNVLLPTLAVNDLIGIAHSGAYGLTASPGLFLSFGYPAEVMVDGHRLIQIRQPETTAQLLARQQPVELWHGEAS